MTRYRTGMFVSLRCPSGKRAYHRRRDAKRALRHLQTQGCEVRQPYECPDCGHWHLTKDRTPNRRLAGAAA